MGPNKRRRLIGTTAESQVDTQNDASNEGAATATKNKKRRKFIKGKWVAVGRPKKQDNDENPANAAKSNINKMALGRPRRQVPRNVVANGGNAKKSVAREATKGKSVAREPKKGKSVAKEVATKGNKKETLTRPRRRERNALKRKARD